MVIKGKSPGLADRLIVNLKRPRVRIYLGNRKKPWLAIGILQAWKGLGYLGVITAVALTAYIIRTQRASLENAQGHILNVENSLVECQAQQEADSQTLKQLMETGEVYQKLEWKGFGKEDK